MDHQEHERSVIEARLERQVLVDQNIEKELQDELAQHRAQIAELDRECEVMGAEYMSVERENAKLKEIAIKAKGTSSKLEKLVYGPTISHK